MRGSPKERFWAKVDKAGSKDYPDCWLWTGAKQPEGYGHFGIDGKIIKTHRYSWFLHNGEIPEGEGYHGTCILHKCDNPSCVNPDHLWKGTHTDNMKDKTQKGKHHNAKRTHCTKGHLLSGKNLYVTPDGRRQCCICRQARVDKFNAKKKG